MYLKVGVGSTMLTFIDQFDCWHIRELEAFFVVGKYNDPLVHAIKQTQVLKHELFELAFDSADIGCESGEDYDEDYHAAHVHQFEVDCACCQLLLVQVRNSDEDVSRVGKDTGAGMAFRVHCNYHVSVLAIKVAEQLLEFAIVQRSCRLQGQWHKLEVEE